MLIKVSQQEFNKQAVKLDQAERERNALVVRCDQLAGLVSWHADEAAYYREERDGWRNSAYEEQTRRREAERLIEEDLGGITIDSQGAAVVSRDLRTKIASLEQQLGEHQRRVVDLSMQVVGRTSEASQLADRNGELRRENAELRTRLITANERLKRAGQMVATEAQRQPLVNAALRLADAFVAVTDHLMGARALVGSEATLNQELEAAHRDYVYEKGRA